MSEPEVLEAPRPPISLTRRGFLRAGLKVGVRTGIAVSGASLGSYVWGRYIEPEWIEVTQRAIALPHLPRAFEGFRIAQISDIHIEDGNMRDDLGAICQLVSRQKADAICLTGDYMTRPAPWKVTALIAGLKHLSAPHGVFGVMGNHDYWGDMRFPRRALRRGGVHELRNTIHVFRRGNARLHLAGSDDWFGGQSDLEGLADQIPRDEAAILLAHEPDLADVVAPLKRFGLMMAGHSHGGQIVLPGVPMQLPALARKYPRGQYQIGDLTLYTNRGVGTVGLPIRFRARPELTVFTLRTA